MSFYQQKNRLDKNRSKQKGLARERLALEAVVDRTVVSKIERAKTNPSLVVLLRLANHLDTTLARLLKANKPL